VQIFESPERRQRVGNSSKVALTDGDQVKHIAVLGELGKQRFRGPQCLGELTILQ